MASARSTRTTSYRLGDACRLLEIQPYVLRHWETEFPALARDPADSGQRSYSEADLQVIRRIKELLYDEGYTIPGARKKLEAERAAGTLGSVAAAPTPAPAPAGAPARKRTTRRPSPAAGQSRLMEAGSESAGTAE